MATPQLIVESVRIQRLGRVRFPVEELVGPDGVERRLVAYEPAPISAVLLAFTLITHGIPGEADLMPARD